MSKTKIVEAKGVKKSFQVGANTFEIIHGVDFDIEAGEYVIFFGPSGCGKSTLLNLCTGLEFATEGKLTIRGEDLSKYSSDQIAHFRQTKIGIVFQQFNLLKSMTIQENVALPLIAAGIGRERAMNRAKNLLHLFGLAKHIKKIHTEISGGQQQRVALARALAANPWILVCDEPTGNLDSKSADDVMEIIYSLNRKSKRTVLLVTHNPDYKRYASKIFEVQDGVIVKKTTNTKRPSLKNVSDFSVSESSLKQT